MPVRIGSQLGSYEVTSLLGKGGMGEVYRARDPKLKRDIAIKILPAEFSRDAERLSRFQREAEVLASLNHPNIAGIYDVQETGDTRFLVLELVEGDTLLNRINRGPIPVEDAVTIAKGISEALEAAHEKGIIHRDLKPANIKITPDGRVKVLDFGLAKTFTSAATGVSNSPTLMSVSLQGVILGTASYMSPEQARGQPVDAQSDIWAFGCIVYEMLTGHQAFFGDTITDILGSIVRAEPDWDELPDGTPPLLRLLLRQCLQKNRATRLHHIGDVRIQLDAALTESPVASKAPAKRKVPVAWIAATMILAATAIGLAPFAYRYFTDASPSQPVSRFAIPSPDKTNFATPGIASPFPSISPDGQTLAFLTLSDGLQRVWIRPLNSLESRPLMGTEGVASFPFWSPDSRYVGFFSQGKLKKIDTTGGPAQVLCDAPGAGFGTWNDDGIIIFNDSVLKRVPASGGTPEAVTALDASRQEIAHVAPQFLPDGRHFLFLSRTNSAQTSAIMAGSLGSKEVKPVLAVSSIVRYDSGHLLFVRDGTLMGQPFDPDARMTTGDAFIIAEQIRYNPLGPAAFSASAGALVYRMLDDQKNRRLEWFDRSGKSLGVVGAAGAYRNPELSPDGKRIAVERTDPQAQNNDIWILDSARGVPTRFTFDPGLDMYPVWSPSGDRIAFGTSRNGVDNLYLMPSGGGPEELLLKDAAIPRDWSRDNRFLTYAVAAGTPTMILPVSGDRKPYAYLSGSNAAHSQSRISPDGKWLAYYSSESGRNEIYVQNFPVPVAKYQVSTEGGVGPRWRRDGREIFYVSLENKLMAVALQTTDKTVEVSASTPLFDVGQGPTGISYGTRQQYDVTADGQRFLVNVAVDRTVETPMIMVLNWLSSIKR